MGPLGGKPGVVVVQPTHGAADIPGGLDRVEPVAGAGHPGAIGYHRALHQRAEVFGALWKAQGQQAAAQGVHQAIARGVQRLGGLDAVGENVIGKGLQHHVIVRALVQVYVGAHLQLL
ncbi:hypothetical protein D3C81_1921300 [compost metagenome]